jgi:RND family efflux transporter MFP subunit
MTYKIFFTSLFLAGISSCSHPDAPAPLPPVFISVYKVKTGDALYYNSYPATVTAVNQVEIRPQVAGYISGIFFKEGQQVVKGQKLYQIDAQQYQGVYEQALAQLKASEANKSKFQEDADRYQELGRQDAVARQTVQHALADLQTAKQQEEAARANLSAVEVNLRYTTINAPLSGTIGISSVKQGASVSPGSTILNTISSDDPIAVDASLEETLIPFIEKVSASKLSRSDSTFTLILADQTRYPYPGKIFIIDRAVDPQTATIKIRFLFPNPGNRLKAGMSANLQILNNSGVSTILIPYKATVEQMAEYFVYIVQADTVAQRKVILGQRIGDMAIVKSGLTVNEIIAIDGVQKLKDGSKVKFDHPQITGHDSMNHPGNDSSGKK